MQPTLTLLMAQINPTVGAITTNTQKIITCIINNQANHDIIVFPELAITGYPPEDLLLREELNTRVAESLQKIQAATKDCYIVVGHPDLVDGRRYNGATVFYRGQQIKHYHKQNIPNYGVFDEARYFNSGERTVCSIQVKGYQVALCICEDIWEKGPVEQIIASGSDILLCINASPFDYEKYFRRENLLNYYARQGLSIIYVNQVGGQDDLLFDGQSLAMSKQGDVCARAPAFVEHLETVTIQGDTIKGKVTPLLAETPLIYQALVCGLKDYVNKNKFPGVVLGLSGGIDSALTLAIAVDALGPERVHAVMMPSRYTASISSEDALKQLQSMNVSSSTLSIESTFQTILETLSPEFAGKKADTTEENIQARIRGLFLMALSNKFGNMVITTSNKSEVAVGYSTLYGDMVGGFSVLKDVFKTQVYDLARYRNNLSAVIPERVLTRPPSAELADNQTDQDKLPEYDILDGILKLYLEKNKSAEQIIAEGYEADVVVNVIKLITKNEYKRRQAAPGVKISGMSFDRDWRYPITSGFLD